MRELTSLSMSFNKTGNSSQNMSQNWEQRRLKADLLDSEARVIALKREVDLLHKLRADMEIQHDHKVSSMKKDEESYKAKIDDLEKRMKHLRQSERKYRTLANTQQSEFDVKRQDLENHIFNLEQELGDLQSSARSNENELNNEISDLTRQLIEIEAQFDVNMKETEMLKKWKQENEEKLENFHKLSEELQREKNNLFMEQNKVKELEFEIVKFGEYQDLMKLNKDKFDKYCEMERETDRLRRKNKDLHELIGGKLLMEEQINDLKTKLKNYEKEHQELLDLRLKCASIQDDLNQWQTVAHHFLPTVENPTIEALKRKFDEILQKDLVILDESSSAKTERAIIESQNEELRTENELAKKQIDDLQRGLKHHQAILARLQKKLQLVVRERDSYKQLLDNYEKDLTISSTAGNNQESNLRFKIETLEKSVTGYKELIARMEQELEAAKGSPDFATIGLMSNTQYEALKNETNQLRLENERLRRRKDELQLEFEMKTLRGAVYGTGKVLHVENNPSNVAQKLQTVQVEKLQAEIEILRRKCKQLEAGNLELTMQLQDQSMVASNIKEREDLQRKIQSLESKNAHLKDVYKSMSQEFREVCYMLFGFRVDRIGKSQYRISSMYADSADDYLHFRLNDEGALDILETEYSTSLADMMRTHLQSHNSLPAFLSSLTLELFNRTTICM